MSDDRTIDERVDAAMRSWITDGEDGDFYPHRMKLALEAAGLPVLLERVENAEKAQAAYKHLLSRVVRQLVDDGAREDAGLIEAIEAELRAISAAYPEFAPNRSGGQE